MTTPSTSNTDIQRVLGLHARWVLNGQAHCSRCNQPWPCETVTLLDDLRVLRSGKQQFVTEATREGREQAEAEVRRRHQPSLHAASQQPCPTGACCSCGSEAACEVGLVLRLLDQARQTNEVLNLVIAKHREQRIEKLTLPAGLNLNALVDERVFGKQRESHLAPNYSGHMNAAWEVVKKLSQTMTYEISESVDYPGKTRVAFGARSATHERVEVAICHAALIALESLADQEVKRE